MQTDDLIEFLSDRLTDKGPATGRVVGFTPGKVAVSFGDEWQWFNRADLANAKKRTVRGTRRRLWMVPR